VIPSLAHDDSLPGADRRQPSGAGGQSLIPGANATAQMIDVAQFKARCHAQSVHRVGELAERNPNETATIVRQWLTESAT